MGLSNKKTETKETKQSTESSSLTRTNPGFVTDALTKFTSGATGLLDRNPTDFVAPASALQTQAGVAAGNLGGYQSGLSAARDLATQAAGVQTHGGVTGRVDGESLLDDLDSHMSPYTQRVVDTTLGNMDVDAGRTRAAQAASGARNGAFGGSRFGVREAQTEGELSRARATAEAQLRDSAFQTGAQLASDDAGRRQQAALANQSAQSADLARALEASSGDANRLISAGGLMGNLSEAAGVGARDDIQTQLATGDALRGVDNETRQAPIGLLGAVGGLLGQGQFGLFNGQDSTGTSNATGTSVTSETPSIMAQIAQAVQTAAAAAALSDERVKADVQTLGHDDRGRRWVSWRYLWEPDEAPRHRGVLAQEIAESDPDAVLTGPMGFLMVDYSKVEGGPWLHS